MRKSAVVLLASISMTACGSPPPSATPPTTAKQNVALPAPPPPAPLVDPVGLVNVAPPPTSVCEVIGKNSFDVSATVDGPALFHLQRGDATLIVGSQGEAFIVATTPSFTIRGFVAHDAQADKSLVYAAKWLSFGGVYFPGIHDAMTATVHDGKLSLTARDDRGFHFAGNSGALDVECDDIGLEPDAKGVLRNSLPPAFEKHDGKLSVLKYTKSVSLSADPDGPAVGTFDVRDGPATVTVIERRGKKARVRSDHFIGWVDASALKPFTPSTRKDIDAAVGDLSMLAVMGRVGEVNPTGASMDASPKLSTAATTLVCTEDVRILALTTSSPNTPFAIGTIPAGKPVYLSSRGDDVSMLVLGDDPKNPRVIGLGSNRFAAPNKDLASCATPSAEPPRVVRGENDDREMIEESNERDAIDELPAETPKKSPHANSPKAEINILSGTLSGTTVLGASPAPRPIVQQVSVNATGALSLDVVTRIVRQNFGRFRSCYQRALAQNPNVAGHVSLNIKIDAKGAVIQVATTSNDIADHNLWQCLGRTTTNIAFATSLGTTDVAFEIGLSVQ